MRHLGRIVPAKLASMVIRNGPTLKDIVLGWMRGLGRKVGSKGDRRAIVGAGRDHFPSIKGFKAPNSDEEGRGELPDVTVHLGILPTLASLLAALTVPILYVSDLTFRAEPVLEGISLAWNLEDIERLPFVVFCMALITFNCLAHHTEEEVNYGTHVVMRKGGPAI